jgi:hypothetical protein
MDAVIEAMRELKRATARELAEATGMSLRTVERYIVHLRNVESLCVLVPHNPKLVAGAIYGMGAGQHGGAFETDTVTQRMVGASDWERGQHAHRSGLLAALFPFNREQA